MEPLWLEDLGTCSKLQHKKGCNRRRPKLTRYISMLSYALTKQIHHLLLLKVVGIMRVNVEKVLERDQKLSELDDRAGKGSDKVMTPEQRVPQLPTVLNFLA
jgi:Synaptobrevin